ncbi:MAG: mechanosensitive ion channel family protein [Planctomycetota bacterium]|jgi:small-conductance mechanosensitive channel
MAVTAWQSFVDFFANPLARGAVWTVLAALMAAVLYIKLKRQLIASDTNIEEARTNRRLLQGGLLFLLLMVLVTIWATVLMEDPAGKADKTRGLLFKVLWTFGLAATVYLLIGAVQRKLSKDITGIEARHKVRLTASWVGIGVFLVAAALIWATGIRDFGIFLGIIGAGLALSLQETLVCIAGWLIFLVRRPYDIGDRVEVNGRIGDVIGVSVFQTTMLEVGNWVKGEQSTGRMLIVPNSVLIRHEVLNYAKGFPFIWDELSIIVTFESDWEKAEELMLSKAELEADKIESQVRRQIEQMQQRYAIRYEQLTPTVYTRIVDNGVDLTLRYLCPVRQRRDITHRLSRNILQAFISHPNIDFAYPTTRIFRNNEEGKPGTGGLQSQA